MCVWGREGGGHGSSQPEEISILIKMVLFMKKNHKRGTKTSAFLLQKIEPSHIFYKEFPLDEDNIFSTNLAENNEIEQIRFKKLKKIHNQWVLNQPRHYFVCSPPKY